MDALNRAALEHAQRLSVDIEQQLRDAPGGAPLVALLAVAQRHATGALVQLADVDADSPSKIRDLQLDLRSYGRIVQWLKDIVGQGFVADDFFDADRREDMMETLGLIDEDEVARLLAGLPPKEETDA